MGNESTCDRARCRCLDFGEKFLAGGKPAVRTDYFVLEPLKVSWSRVCRCHFHGSSAFGFVNM
jgi:hypothetical protein